MQGGKMDIKRLPSQALVLFLAASNCFNHFQFNFTRVCKHDMWRQYPLVTVGWPMSWPTTITQNSTDPAVPGPKSANKDWGSWTKTKTCKALRQVKRTTKEKASNI